MLGDKTIDGGLQFDDGVEDAVLEASAHRVVREPVDALRRAPLLSAPDAGLGLAGLGHNGRSTDALLAQQNEPGPPDTFLRALGIRDDRLQSLTIAERYGEGDTAAHSPDSHRLAQMGILNLNGP